LDKKRSGGCRVKTAAFDADVDGLKFTSSAMPQLAAVQPIRKIDPETRFVLKTSRRMENRTRPHFTGFAGGIRLKATG